MAFLIIDITTYLHIGIIKLSKSSKFMSAIYYGLVVLIMISCSVDLPASSCGE